MLTYDDLVTFWEEITNTHYGRYGGWHGEIDRCQGPPCLCPLSWLAEMCLSTHLSASTHPSAK